MWNKFLSLFSSMKFAALLLLIFAFVIGYATFIENDFGSSSSKALIYNTWWFELILILLCAVLLLNIFKHNLFRKEKLATLTFHLAFIVIIIGSGVTRYLGYEGMMIIGKGDAEEEFLSDGTFLQIHVNDSRLSKQINPSCDTCAIQWEYDKNLYLSGITKRFDKIPVLRNIFSNYFYISGELSDQDFLIEYVDFIPNAVKRLKCISSIDLLVTNPTNPNDPPKFYKKGEEFYVDPMSLLTIQGNRYMISEFLYEDMHNINLNGFILNTKDSEESNVGTDISITDMIIDSVLIEGESQMKDIKFTLNDPQEGAVNFLLEKEYSSLSYNMDDSEKNSLRRLDALIIRVISGSESKEVILFGKKGYLYNDLLLKKFDVGDLEFKFTYGPKKYVLEAGKDESGKPVPFYIRLNEAIVDRYPGSENASSYASEVTVIDPLKDTFDFRIFMNNILNHNGYRFYQSNIDMENESWTGLSVNNDRWGTIVSYIGYGLLFLGIILVFFFKQTRMRFLTGRLKKIESKNMTK